MNRGFAGFSVFIVVLLFVLDINFAYVNTNHSIHDLSCQTEVQKNTISVHKLDSLFDCQLEEGLSKYTCPGLAVVAIDLKGYRYKNIFGVADYNAYTSINTHTAFRLGSVSKGFAGILSALLIRKGYFTLEDPLSMYISDFDIKDRLTGEPLKVKHILSHTTGWTEHAYSNLIDQGYRLSDIKHMLSKLKPKHQIGTTYAYQNGAFALISEVVENTTGMPYELALDHYLLSPLGLCETSCDYTAMASNGNHALGHKVIRQKKNIIPKPVPLMSHYYNAVPAGGVNSTMHDMEIWLEALLGMHKHIIDDATLAIAFDPQVETTFDDRYFNEWSEVDRSYYALGWRVLKTPYGDWVYHGGLVNGFRTEILLFPSDGKAVVFMFNSTCGYTNKVMPEFMRHWIEASFSPS